MKKNVPLFHVWLQHIVHNGPLCDERIIRNCIGGHKIASLKKATFAITDDEDYALEILLKKPGTPLILITTDEFNWATNVPLMRMCCPKHLYVINPGSVLRCLPGVIEKMVTTHFPSSAKSDAKKRSLKSR